MANRSTLRPIARVGDDPIARQLRDIAALEAAGTKERLATRTAAARLFSGAVARSAEAKAAWERRQTSVVRVLKCRLAVLVERADALHPVGMHRRAPVLLHHHGYGLLDGLTLP